MNILFGLSFLILIPIIVGLVLVISGHSIGVWILALGTPSIMVILLIVGLIMLTKGKLYKKQSENNSANQNTQQSENEQESITDDDNPSEKEREQRAINAVNTSPYYLSKFKLAEYEALHVAEGMKNSSKKGLILGITFFLSFVAEVILATVFAINRIWIGMIICIALFAASIIAVIITALVREIIYSHSDISKAQKFVCGKVRSCVMSSMATSKINRSVRINKVVYNVTVSADNTEYRNISKRFYETDEKVVVAVMGKNRSKIVEKTDLENQSNEIKSKYTDCITTGETVIISQASADSSSDKKH